MTERGPDPRDPRSSDDPLPDDPALRELREAWRALRPRAADEGGADVLEDATTRAAVDWMRAAWRTVEAPAARPPAGRLFGGRGPRGRWRRAAALAAGVVAVAWIGARLQRSGSDVRLEDEAAPRTAAAESLPGSPPEASPEPAAPDGPDPGPRVVSLGPDHLEMRSGPVRLILFQEPSLKN